MALKADNSLTVSVDGHVVATVQTLATRGMVALTSGWHEAEFDNFAMIPLKEWIVSSLYGENSWLGFTIGGQWMFTQIH